MTDERNFWLKVERTDGCWEWLASRSTAGYGRIWWNGKLMQAHRVSYELFFGAIPIGMDLDHLCRNRGCVNPYHVEPVTRRTNLLRGLGIPAISAARTHCAKGHPFTVSNTYWYRGSRQCRICRRLYGKNRYKPRGAYRRVALCATCGIEFEFLFTRGRLTKFCSAACRKVATNAMSREYQRRKRAA